MCHPTLKRISIHSYKHSGILYRRWDKPIIYDEDDNHLILIIDTVTISNINDPITKRTKDPAVWIFPKGKWYNFIVNLKPNGLSTYINIASPFIIEENALKYIDYDLDIKIIYNKKVKLLDLKEHEENIEKYSYSEELIKIINEVKEKLIANSKLNGHPYSREKIQKIINHYTEIKRKNSI